MTPPCSQFKYEFAGLTEYLRTVATTDQAAGRHTALLGDRGLELGVQQRQPWIGQAEAGWSAGGAAMRGRQESGVPLLLLVLGAGAAAQGGYDIKEFDSMVPERWSEGARGFPDNPAKGQLKDQIRQMFKRINTSKCNQTGGIDACSIEPLAVLPVSVTMTTELISPSSRNSSTRWHKANRHRPVHHRPKRSQNKTKRSPRSYRKDRSNR